MFGDHDAQASASHVAHSILTACGTSAQALDRVPARPDRVSDEPAQEHPSGQFKPRYFVAGDQRLGAGHRTGGLGAPATEPRGNWQWVDLRQLGAFIISLIILR